MPFTEDRTRPCRPPRRLSRRRLIVAALGLTLLVGLMAMAGGMAAVSRNPAFCGSCHEMEPAFHAWRQSAHCQPERGKVATCQDCHHPPGLEGHLTASLRGVVHLSKHLFHEYDAEAWAAEQAARADRARNIISNSACTRCHNPKETAPYLTTVSHSRIDESIRCVDCHRNLMQSDRAAIEEVLTDGQVSTRGPSGPELN